MKKNFFKKTNYKKGFSLVELLVVTLIFFILTGIVLFRQGKFSSDILITSTAYELALFIREAQVYGVGSKINPGSSSNSRFAYGVHFSNSALGTKEVTLFADVPNSSGVFDYKYDSSSDVLVNKIQFKQEQVIHDFCGIKNSTEYCKGDGVVSSLNIAFEKPDLNAKIFGIVRGSTVEYTEGAVIRIKSSLGDKCRTVRINPLGQISIDPVVSGTTGCERS